MFRYLVFWLEIIRVLSLFWACYDRLWPILWSYNTNATFPLGIIQQSGSSSKCHTTTAALIKSALSRLGEHDKNRIYSDWPRPPPCIVSVSTRAGGYRIQSSRVFSGLQGYPERLDSTWLAFFFPFYPVSLAKSLEPWVSKGVSQDPVPRDTSVLTVASKKKLYFLTPP